MGVLPAATDDRVPFEDDCYLTSNNRPVISLEIKTQIIKIEKKINTLQVIQILNYISTKLNN